jgi:hypothetical protein
MAHVPNPTLNDHTLPTADNAVCRSQPSYLQVTSTIPHAVVLRCPTVYRYSYVCVHKHVYVK